MVVYGFLSYENGKVSIPNKELMDRFADMVQKEVSLGYIILELKVDQTPEEALAQIKDKKYAMRFMGKMGEKPAYTGRILGVGISYDREKKCHNCRQEVLRQDYGNGKNRRADGI